MNTKTCTCGPMPDALAGVKAWLDYARRACACPLTSAKDREDYERTIARLSTTLETSEAIGPKGGQ